MLLHEDSQFVLVGLHFIFWVAEDEYIRIEDGRLTVTITTTYDAVMDSPKCPPPISTCRNSTDLMQGVRPSAEEQVVGQHYSKCCRNYRRKNSFFWFSLFYDGWFYSMWSDFNRSDNKRNEIML